MWRVQDCCLDDCMAFSAQHMPGSFHLKACILLVLLCPTFSGAVNLSQCLADVTSCATNPTGQNCALNISNITALSVLRTSNGSSVSNYTDVVTAISYTGCVNYCGKEPESFSWTFFSQEYAVWLLPYLALVSQLPFGAQRRTDNLMSTILTLGSPTLAGYSLYITLLNTRWLNDQLFSGVDYPSAAVRHSVVRALSGLQQVPLRIHPGDSGQFDSLLKHLGNDQWWSTFADELDYSHAWSIASATSITWVVIAYLLTVADSLSDVANHLNSNGQGTGSVWLWLLPIVVGWLILSPKCDYNRVHKAFKKANKHALLHSRDPSVDSVQDTSDFSNFGLTISPSSDPVSSNEVISPDELRIPPVFNYARTLSWCRDAYVISLFYRAAWLKSDLRDGAKGQPVRKDAHSNEIIRYCHPYDRAHCARKVLWPRGMFFNMVVASLVSLQLQWGTTGAALLAVWYTPTIGFGCRSLAYLMYGTLSTMVWLLLVLSSALKYYAYHLDNDPPPADLEGNTEPISITPSGMSRSFSVKSVADESSASTCVAPPMAEIQDPSLEMEEVTLLHSKAGDACNPTVIRPSLPGRMYVRAMTRVADWLRWIGKSLAVVNAIGIIANSIFQYAGVYDNCYCDSSVLGWGPSAAFAVISPNAHDIRVATSAWIGALALGLTSCAVFVGTIFLVRDPVPS